MRHSVLVSCFSTRESSVWVFWFLSRACKRKQAHTNHQTTYVLLRKHSCAPEIINGAEEGYSGVKIDAWSCGIILYLLLTGTLPFQNEDMTQLYEQINRCKVEYPSWMPPDARDLISKLLEKDPDRRFSLEQVKQHQWFLVDYDTADAEAGRRSSDHGRADTGRSTGNSSASSRGGGGRAARGNSRGSKSRDNIGRRSADMVPAPAAPEPEKLPVLKDVTTEFGARPLDDLIRAALPGKPQKRIEDVVNKLADLDIDCVEDIQFLAETLKNPPVLTKWLEDKSKLPSLTCMRISSFFFE